MCSHYVSLCCKLCITFRDENTVKKARGYFKLTQVQASADVELTWLYLENMLLKAIGTYQNLHYNSSSQLKVFYSNPRKEFTELQAGSDLKVDTLWE